MTTQEVPEIPAKPFLACFDQFFTLEEIQIFMKEHHPQITHQRITTLFKVMLPKMCTDYLEQAKVAAERRRVEAEKKILSDESELSLIMTTPEGTAFFVLQPEMDEIPAMPFLACLVQFFTLEEIQIFMKEHHPQITEQRITKLFEVMLPKMCKDYLEQAKVAAEGRKVETEKKILSDESALSLGKDYLEKAEVAAERKKVEAEKKISAMEVDKTGAKPSGDEAALSQGKDYLEKAEVADERRKVEAEKKISAMEVDKTRAKPSGDEAALSQGKDYLEKAEVAAERKKVEAEKKISAMEVDKTGAKPSGDEAALSQIMTTSEETELAQGVDEIVLKIKEAMEKEVLNMQKQVIVHITKQNKSHQQEIQKKVENITSDIKNLLRTGHTRLEERLNLHKSKLEEQSEVIQQIREEIKYKLVEGRSRLEKNLNMNQNGITKTLKGECKKIVEDLQKLHTKMDTLNVSSLVSSTTISQLMHEVKELRAHEKEKSTKLCYLEKRPDEAHNEMHRLRERCKMLESMSGSSIAKAGGSHMETHSPYDSNLDSTEAILLLGGFDGSSASALSSVQSYFPSRNVVKAHSSMSCIRSSASVAKLDGKIYIFGGDDGVHGWYNTAESYNETDSRWSLCPPLNDAKGCLGGATLDGKIFAIGGGNNNAYFSDVEMLDPDLGRWIKTMSMKQKRFAVASSEHNGSIYAVGGYNENAYLKTAERFDPREHSWMKNASMKSRRGCHSLVVLNEKLYAIGGFDGSTMVPSVEIYDPRRGTWIAGEPMKESRGYSAAAVVKDTIYVIGGYKGEGEDMLDTVECFKEGEGWKNVPCSSIGRRGFLSAVAL